MDDSHRACAGDASRREFLSGCARAALGVAIVGLAAPLLEACSDNGLSPVDGAYSGVFDVSSLTTDGTALVTSARGGDGFPIIIVRTSSTTFVALSTQCTHEGCQVDAPTGPSIACACHGARFDLDGTVTQGPARQNLYRYRTTFDATTKRLTVEAQA